MSEYLLSMQHISKSFGPVKVLNDVEFNVKPGEVHVLIGENGAGKSTLMKILIGLYEADQGEIYFKGELLKPEKMRNRLDHGIAMIHQELNPELDMTVAENVFMGREMCGKGGFVKDKVMKEKTRELLDMMGGEGIRPSMKMRELSVAQMQMIEIVKAVSQNADLIIMDEPTSAITQEEVEKLFKVIRQLKEKGAGIVYISHKMDEIFTIGDRITVLRDGSYIGTREVKDTTHAELVKMMVGRELNEIYQHTCHASDEVVFELRDFSKEKLFSGINLELHAGEILGIAGLMGAGRSEIVETAFGIRGKYTGKIFVKGKEVRMHSERVAISNRIALVTEDRKASGLFLGLPIKHNISVSNLKKLCRYGWISKKRENEETDRMIKQLNVKTADSMNEVRTLSGGNMQKVVLSKWLMMDPDIIIFDEPTRGIDIGAKAEIYKIMEDLAAQGKGVIMISSELPEIMGMSDRILVVCDGKLTGEVGAEEFSQEKIMMLATGCVQE